MGCWVSVWVIDVFKEAPLGCTPVGLLLYLYVLRLQPDLRLALPRGVHSRLAPKCLSCAWLGRCVLDGCLHCDEYTSIYTLVT